MNFEEVKELINIINNCEIAYFELEKEGISIKMDKSYNRGIEKNTKNVNESNYNYEKEVINNSTNSNAIEKKEVNVSEVKEDDKNLYIIKSPMVGTFYDSPSVNAEPYVKVGSKVKKGDVLCIIEAMKLMNEILSEEDGEIIEVLANREKLVEYGEPLFKIRRA